MDSLQTHEALVSALLQYTVANIRAIAKQEDVKLISGLRKKELANYVAGNILKFRYRLNLTALQLRPSQYKTDWLTVLRTYGVVVVPIKDFNHQQVLDDFWTWTESINCGVVRNQPSTHLNEVSTIPT